MYVKIKKYPHTRFVVKFFESLKLFSIVGKISDYLESRRIKIRVDDFDTWNADTTLSHIIVAVLEKYKNNTKGSPIVEFCDAPEHLIPNDPDKAWKRLVQDGETDEHFEDRWQWILDEMIYAFRAHQNDEMVFFSNDEIERVKNGMRLFAKYYGSLWN